MAKRFTDSQKYRKHFLRQLPSDYKLLWDFLYHECDHAGVWICDFEIAQICLKTKTIFSAEKALKVLNAEEEKIIVIDKGKKWFIPSFIRFQYGELNENIKPHLSAMRILKSNGINPKTLTYSSVTEESVIVDVPESNNQYSELPKDVLIPITKLAEVYKNDKKLLLAISETSKKKVSFIKQMLPEFVANLESQGRRSEKARDFAIYFKNWLKYKEEPTEKNKTTLDWSLLETNEQYTLSHSEQVELIKRRMHK